MKVHVEKNNNLERKIFLIHLGIIFGIDKQLFTGNLDTVLYS